ncbi:MAG: hypothetical protein ACOY4R_13080 [Pseudomonadota bacterium]
MVISTCIMAFAIVVIAGKESSARRAPPIGLIAHELGTTPERLQRALDTSLPPAWLGPPSESQKRHVAAILDVSPRQLDEVMERYRRAGLRSP